MMKSTLFETPKWYWSRGLHDAIVKSVHLKEFSFNHRDKNQIRNSLIIEVDSRCAMYDTTICTIRFININKKALDNLELSSLIGSWWIQDDLSFCQNKRKWTIKIFFGKTKTKTVSLNFCFDYVEINQ